MCVIYLSSFGCLWFYETNKGVWDDKYYDTIFFSIRIHTHSNKRYGGVFSRQSTKVFFQKSEPN